MEAPYVVNLDVFAQSGDVWRIYGRRYEAIELLNSPEFNNYFPIPTEADTIREKIVDLYLSFLFRSKEVEEIKAMSFSGNFIATYAMVIISAHNLFSNAPSIHRFAELPIDYPASLTYLESLVSDSRFADLIPGKKAELIQRMEASKRILPLANSGKNADLVDHVG